MNNSFTYNPQNFEKKWYKFWTENNFFSSEINDKKKSFTVVLPPPNITGILHMGHFLNCTIQDILVRKARMQGREACFVPGTDHASIATESKVVAFLKEKNIEKKNLSREEFLSHVWSWKEEYGNKILNQLKEIGISCDWNRNNFTMDDHFYDSVQNIFIKLYQDGLIYRDSKMINWDPKAQTSISDDEVIFKEVESELFYIKYKIKNEDSYLTIATTRPETIFGDVALCLNQNDPRFETLKNKKVIVPIINREISIISDELVDISFGSGILKITPCHSFLDYEIGKKYNLEMINILNKDGSLNQNCKNYQNQDRFFARENIIKELKKLDLIEKIEKIKNSIGFSERTDSIVEPMISTQWFLKMDQIVKPAIEAVEKEEIKFFPEKFTSIYYSWLKNIKDWCISRQLFWGHRIPVFYLKSGEFFVAKNLEEALNLAKNFTKNFDLKKEDLAQDDDVLDTWFSSWIWPIEVFRGISNPLNRDFLYYYPTSDIVTAPEIIFFWIARMIVAGFYFTGKKPFSNVYFTGIVRDKKREKMSKSKGNSPSPIDLIEKYGCDGIRLGLICSSSAGNDLLFDEKFCDQGKNFANKLWNASILISSFKYSEKISEDKNANTWIENRLNKILQEVENYFASFKISQALICIYKFFWDDFCSFYLEIIKSKEISQDSFFFVKNIFEKILKILHPFIPFVSEEIWQKLYCKEKIDSISIQPWPTHTEVDEKIEDFGKDFIEFSTKIRNFKNENKIQLKSCSKIFFENEKPKWYLFFENSINKLLNLEIITEKKNSDLFEKIQIGSIIISILKEKTEKNDQQEKVENNEKEIYRLEKFLKQINEKLSNEKFLQNVSKELIEKEIKKKNDTEIRLNILKK
jgi:valyl-tRNA synthetase